MIKPYTTVSKKLVFDSKYMKVYEDEFLDTKGNEGKYYYYYSQYETDMVHAVGVDKSTENLILTRQYRYPVKKIVIDVAGGAIDKGESNEDAAVRELFEETGYKGSDIIHLGKCTINPAKAGYWLHEYLVLNAEKVGDIHGGELSEETEVVLLPIKDAWKWIAENKIDSCHSISTITKALIYMKVDCK
jgi:ADP-ribose pyrophosphatase